MHEKILASELNARDEVFTNGCRASPAVTAVRVELRTNLKDLGPVEGLADLATHKIRVDPSRGVQSN